LETVKWIVAHEYPLDEERIEKAMASAASYDHIDVLKYFLNDLKVDINSEYYYATVLSDSTYAAGFETIKFLVDNGADINGGKDRIFTPLDRAVTGNRADVVQYLLEHGADADFVGTDDGYTPSRPLTDAIQNGYFDIVKVLVDHGVELDYHEGWFSGEDTPIEIAESEKSRHIIDYINGAQNNK
jgi:ankyrin repeat protein